MSNPDIDILKRALQRAKAARRQAEEILEEKSKELYEITQELKHANAKLKEGLTEKTSELQGVFGNLVDAYVLMDIFGNVIKMNESAVELFGYDINSENLNVTSLIYKEDYKYAMKSFNQLVMTGKFSDYQARVYTKHKGIRIVHINASLIYDKDKKPIAAQGIVRDITEELHQKQVFDEQKNQLSTIVDNSSLGIVLTRFGEIIQTNKAFEQLLGYSQQELQGLGVKGISIKEDYPASAKFMEKLNAGEIDNFSINKRYKKNNGSLVWAKTNVAAVRDQDDNIKYQVALVEDITNQLEAEKQKEKLLSNLEKTNQELKDYAHIVSHDLKSPLRSINALVNWIKEDYYKELEGSGLDNIALIENTLEKMESLINGILNYSSAGNRNNLETEKIDLNDTISDITNTIFIPKHVTVSIKNKLPHIHADKTRIQQLFQNIISNAVNYIDKKEGRVEIDYSDQGSFYVFQVKDNGVGIKKESHEKIFKIFQSLSNDRHSTGIGLSIVKKIVDLYEGDIWLESEVGIGTTFFFSLKKKY
ncbi:PAS domain S-box protein [Aquimarina sp. 2201CG5-10]|uniref:PAS domain S-box protein n=1 Tax=Aquimarina callyspongiae TaxID=3098150 RepID=UPI002AB42236|nr:PAS domain S-box protein [Aquimarina sp. 2201CG5-10]MDY8134636.1 PAS domain S-box protein [Aquimarina sp. 2201CG5-10]